MNVNQYRRIRMDHWNRASDRKACPDRIGAYYQELMINQYRFLVPEGMAVLEIGCGHGGLLAALNPSFGAGIDFSEQMIHRAKSFHPHLFFVQADAHDIPLDKRFDIIILSDLVNDIWDVQAVFENLKKFCHAETRLIINYYSNMWRMPLALAKRMGWGADLLEQNWFDTHDVVNLLNLAGFEVINHRFRILMPLRIPAIAVLCNRWLVNFLPFSWFALTNIVVARSESGSSNSGQPPLVSIIVAARNEAGNIESIFQRIPVLGRGTELIFVEGHSTDNTYESIEKHIENFPGKKSMLFRQTGKGKGDAVRLGFEKAKGDILIILDADLTVAPEDLHRFVDALISGKGEFINGVRLVYPMENRAMRIFNLIGNKFFSLAFSWLLGQPIKDTLCGTKAMWKRDYDRIAKYRNYFGEFDPFGDFDLLFGAAKLNLKIVDMPIRYRERTYGNTNINRWKHGWLLLKMVLFAARRIKFI
jgi:2-polyprenyl-3-methyl-5-hydroxy-6-metoxy-1,4-benzoquinol methylase